MKLYRILAIGLGIALVAPISLVSAQGDENSCVEAINTSLAREQRMYRGVLFGEPSVEDAPVGNVKFDGSGKPWIRIKPIPPGEDEAEDSWASVSGEGEDSKTMQEAADDFGLSVEAASSAPDGTARADEDNEIWVKVGGSWKEALDLKDDDEIYGDVPTGDGIFGTRRIMTSELVPYLTQTMRALQCKTAALCQQVELSFSGGSAQDGPAGCMQMGGTISACDFTDNTSGQPDVSKLRSYCERTSKELLEREAELLKLAVEYDAAYRSILQFAGNFDLALHEFRWPLTFSLRQSTGVIAELGRIPCFLGSCDAYPDTPEFR
jgi:hypothetical protein